MRFGATAVVVHPWDGLALARGQHVGVRLELDASTRLDFFAMGSGETLNTYREGMGRLPTGCYVVWIPRTELAGVEEREFIERARAAIARPGSRRMLPTFYQPDGPAEAVLAGLK